MIEKMENRAFETMNLIEAAAFLKIHPGTLSVKAASGEIPGSKIGKRWVFVDIDLVIHIRAQYQMRALQSDRKETVCHSTNARTRPSGGLRSVSTGEQYKDLLGLRTKFKP